jgi:hypothetical protein
MLCTEFRTGSQKHSSADGQREEAEE